MSDHFSSIDLDDSSARISYAILHDVEGAIVHIHKHVSYTMASLARLELERHARSLLQQIRPETGNRSLSFLLADTLPITLSNSHLAVDTKTGALIAKPSIRPKPV